MTYKVWDIKYDTDDDETLACSACGSTASLPSQMHIDIHPKGDVPVDELLGDAISEVTGFCHFGFKYGSLDDKPIVTK
jgi:hypothetical protein